MDALPPPPLPPVIPGEIPAEPPPSRATSTGRRWIAFGLLAAYPLYLGLGGARDAGPAETALPRSTQDLLIMCAINLGLFAVVFAVACLVGGIHWRELRLRWRTTFWIGGKEPRRFWLPPLGAAWPIILGFVYAILLRILVAAAMLLILGAILAVHGGGADTLEKVRPRIENVVPADALRDPLYLILSVTVLSFGVAGLREELWRVAMLAAFLGICAFSRTRSRSLYGEVLGVLVAAVVFGLGHLPQGWSGMFMTGLLGFGLGWIIVMHDSIWEAVMAHGFFDATTFLLLWILLETGLLKQMIPV